MALRCASFTLRCASARRRHRARLAAAALDCPALQASPYAPELEAAVLAVRAASALCRAAQASIVAAALDPASADKATKADDSPVTTADFAAQALISHLLEEACPRVSLLGEEDASSLRQPAGAEQATRVAALVNAQLAAEGRPSLSLERVLAAIDRGASGGGRTGRFWCLDPIDGTKGFVSGRQYTVALALVSEGVPVVGLMGCPNLGPATPAVHSGEGTLFVAAAGCGAYQLPLATPLPAAWAAARPIALDAARPAAAARYVESMPESACAAHSDTAAVAARLGLTAPPVRADSMLKYGLCARGEAELYMRFPPDGYLEKTWDHAAGQVIYQEAGGVVSDGAGAPLDFGAGRLLRVRLGIVAAPAHLHQQLLAAVGAAVVRTSA